MPVSAIVITLNEAAHIEACLASLAWADERLVVDSGSTDDTVAIAERCGARVIMNTWPGYSAQKNFAADRAVHDWIVSVDADERVTPELAVEMQRVMASPGDRAGFRVPRVTFHLGRWMRCTDWYPDYQLRLYDRRRATWNGRRVHESVTASGPVGQLTHELQHFAYRDIAHHLDTINKYTTLAAEHMHAEGRRTNYAELLLHPPAAFLRNYLLRGGITAGVPGLIVSSMNAYYVFLKFAKLAERCR
ncbi:MAG: glycosyltransferase family 2 protein [Acidobacteria bacterium]|nr:glycosyltransferase family 2 protein [Acidobacteriota bacterium]